MPPDPPSSGSCSGVPLTTFVSGISACLWQTPVVVSPAPSSRAPCSSPPTPSANGTAQGEAEVIPWRVCVLPPGGLRLELNDKNRLCARRRAAPPAAHSTVFPFDRPPRPSQTLRAVGRSAPMRPQGPLLSQRLPSHIYGWRADCVALREASVLNQKTILEPYAPDDHEVRRTIASRSRDQYRRLFSVAQPPFAR